MKKIFTIALLSLAVCVQAQELSTKSKAAIKLYQSSKIAVFQQERMALLEKAIAKDNNFIEACVELSRIYINIDSFQKAVNVMEDLYTRVQDDKVKLYLAEAYYRNADYKQATETFDLIANAKYKENAREFGRKFKNALRLYNHPVDFSPVKLGGVNTDFDDYFPSITADGSMMSTTVLNPIYDYVGNERLQEDMYVSYKKNDGTWTKARPLAAPLNSLGNEGSQSFSSDGRYMFFVLCNHPDNIGSCDIYYAIHRGDSWSEPMNLGAPANTEYWESNPVMSPAGDEIYFVSNRPGGIGGRDIWKVKVRILKDGRLEPYKDENLGEPINTRADEFAPFIHADGNTLYFSSDGHDGMGGRDIFMSDKSMGQWSNPKNIGYPINTNAEESGFVVNGEGTKAYYASKKTNEENSHLDIYEIDLPEEVRPAKMLYSPGVVYDAATKRPLQAFVEIFDQTTNKKIFESLSDKVYGEFVAILPEGGSYGLSIRQEGYLFYTKEITNPGDTIVIPLQPIVSGNKTRVDNLFFDTDKDEILPSSYAVIQHLADFLKANSKVKIEIVGHTDNVGSAAHNNDLSLRRAEALKRALTVKGISESRITTRGAGASQPVATNATEEGRSQNRRVEVVIL